MYKYEEIAKKIEKKILDVEYEQGEKLPSIRQLCKLYNCNKATAIKTYEVLIDKHLIYSKHQSGYYVADNAIKPFSCDQGYLLNTGNPVISATSLIDAKHCLSIAIEQYSQSSSNISLQGVESLREILPEYLVELGVYAKYDNIYLTQGITQILSFLSMSEFPNHHSTILIEEPTYSYYIKFLKSMNLPISTIKRDINGIDLVELENIFKNHDIKFFYTIPRNHNPLGTTLDTKTRKKIAELALKYNVYIIEDDYFGHCSSVARYLPISYYTMGKSCIYLTSYSKTIPHIRLGICVIDDLFSQTFKKIIHQSYYFSYQLPSLISQATFESYLRSSLYQKQVQRLQHQFQQHFFVMKDVSRKWNPDIAKISSSYSGYYFSIVLHPSIDLDKLEKQLEQEKIYIARNERCFYNQDHFDHSIRLSIARVSPSQLREALDYIYNIIVIDMLS